MVSLIGQNLVGGGQALSGLPRAAESVPAAAPSVPTIPSDTAIDIPNTDALRAVDVQQQRAEAYKQAIDQALPRFFYPVSDVKFTIFKENGQYITKFTNIISGQTTQIPEPELLQQISDIGGLSFVNAMV